MTIKFRKLSTIVEVPKLSAAKKKMGVLGLYEHMIERSDMNVVDRSRLSAEAAWYSTGRSYYNIYPCVLRMCERLKLSTPCPEFTLPGVFNYTEDHSGLELCQAIQLRFPEGCRLNGMLVVILRFKGEDTQIRCFSDLNENSPEGLVQAACNITPGDNATIESMLSESYRKDEIDDLQIRVVACLGLLCDPELDFLEREVLRRDRGKQPTQSILDRAERLNGKGWSLGKSVESTPAMVDPFWAVRWTGPGRKIPKLRPISGYIRGKSKIKQVPTGTEAVAS